MGIGNQCWFKENLRSDNYRNGDPIPGNLSNGQWNNTTLGAQTVYNNSDSNLATYGSLYNWYAVNDARGLCPTGFHVPMDGEWMVLESFLGGASVAGAKMKSSPSDTPAWNGTNSSGFSALPGGYRDTNIGAQFDDEGLFGFWWSSLAVVTVHAWACVLNSGLASTYRSYYYQQLDFSVRCLKD